MTIIVLQQRTIYPEGANIFYKLVWTAPRRTLEVSLRPIAHAFLLASIDFDNDPTGALVHLLQTTSTLSVASTAFPTVFSLQIPAVPKLLGRQQAACIDRA